MRRSGLLIFFCWLAMAVWALPPFPAHNLHICGVDYSIQADVFKSKKQTYYRLTIGKKKYVLGAFDNTARESFTKTIREFLQKGDRFPFSNPCVPTPGSPATVSGLGEAAQNIDQLIKDLIAEAFPATHLTTITQPINDNNILRLYQRADNGRYQLSIIIPTGEVSLVSYAAPIYAVDWGTLRNATTQVIRDHFDQFLMVYYRMPPTTTKPDLFLQFNSGTRTYEVIWSDDGHDGFTTGVMLAEDVGKKLAGDAVDNLNVNHNTPRLANVINPNTPKKSKDDAKLPEDQ